MASRLSLQKKLTEILGNNHVYYEPPEKYKLSYPCFIYMLDDKERRSADNIGYIIKNRYQITLIDYLPDNPAIDKIMELPYCSFERSYKSDNLEHYVVTLYW